MNPNTTWEIPARAKREGINSAIPSNWTIPNPASEQTDLTGDYIRSFLTDREIEVTETDAVGITEKTCSGEWTAVEVTGAFCKRAGIAHRLVNCLHEVFFDAAVEDARRLDAYFAQYGKPIGPLHGLPVSLKDQFHVKGVETTMGYVGWIGTFEGNPNDARRCVVESQLVRELRSLGAILYCKTSVPMTLMSGETANNIIGYVPNPKNTNLSAGGSSGGEAALIALRGSPCGFGTDIGGSIRSPAGWNGIFGLRPSAGRVSYQGAANSMDGQNTILSVVGPMATTARSLTLLFKGVLSQEPWLHDPLVVELPWRSDVESELQGMIERSRGGRSELAFGIMHHDGLVRPHPPADRAMRMVEQTLKRLGHKVIEWNPPSHRTAIDIAAETFSMDGGHDVRHQLGLSGEPPVPNILVKKGEQMTASEIAALNVKKREYQKQYMDYWNSTAASTGTGRPVDGVICPLGVQAATIPGKYNHVGYTTFLSALDYTGIAIPVTCADKRVDVPRVDMDFLNDADREIQSQYDAEAYDGGPVGVQLFGRRFQEEKMLMLAEYMSAEIEKDFKE